MDLTYLKEEGYNLALLGSFFADDNYGAYFNICIFVR